MRTLAPYFLFAVFAMQTSGLHAQTAEKTKPGFTLALYWNYRSGVFPPGTQVFLATYTNTSDKVADGPTCAELGAFYLEVVYNGMDVTQGYPQQTGFRGTHPCRGIGTLMMLGPGEIRNGYLYYDASKPGTYSFTVVQDSFPKDPAKNVTVRSDTVTLVVQRDGTVVPGLVTFPSEPLENLVITPSNIAVVQKSDPGFTLALSVPRRDGTMVSYQQGLLVTYTNVSSAVAYESNCGAFGALYQLAVTYNGIPVKEPAEAQRHRKIAESGQCFGGSNPGRNLQPGQSRQDHIYYDTFKPGTYEFTVEQNSDPRHPKDNVTVRSNTVTIVVPTASTGAVPHQ